MFGKVLSAWETGWGRRPEVAAIWSDLDQLKNMRKNIHLFKAANVPKADYKQLLADEKTMFASAIAIITALQCMRPLDHPD